MSEDAFEREMSAVSTVYSLRPGHTLTQQDYDAIQLYDEVSRSDQERATDAFNRGYKQGLREGGSAEIGQLHARIDDQFVQNATDQAMRKMAEVRAGTLLTAVREMGDSLRDCIDRLESCAQFAGNEDFAVGLLCQPFKATLSKYSYLLGDVL